MQYGTKEYLIMWCVILFGAIVHATSQLKASRENKTEFTRVDFIILFIIACFAGMIFWLVAALFFDSIIRIILATAVGSFMWLVWLNRIAWVLLDVITNVATRGLPPKNNQNDNN